MKLSTKAKNLLKRVGKTDDSSLPMTRQNRAYAQELKVLGLAEIIPCSQGGGIIALTTSGVNLYTKCVEDEK